MANRFFNDSTKALDSFLNNKAAEALNKIPAPAKNLIGAILPGIGGGVDTTNVFSRAVLDETQIRIQQERLAQARLGERTGGEAAKQFDWRARLRPKNGGRSVFYGNSPLMEPVQSAGGLVWQYTPNIYISASAQYDQVMTPGQNYPIRTFVNSIPPDITVSSDFTANNIKEAKYILSALHFLRMSTKAYFGEIDAQQGLAGAPPPVMLFEYLGEYGFNKVPVVVANFSATYPPNVDYVPVELSAEVTYVPVQLNLQVTLSVQYTPQKVRERFSLDELRSGRGYKDGFI